MKLQTAFLIGAGFSYPSGIAVMHDLAVNFPKVLNEQEKEIYHYLLELIPEIREDFEMLMQICRDLKRIPFSLLNKIAYRTFGAELVDLEKLASGAKTLEFKLKLYLEQACQVKKNKMHYLFPFAQWLKKNNYAIEIFSLNYDLLVENLCEEFFLPYTDGFLINWSPELFKSLEFQVYLYKLHGSFIWYQTESGHRLKIPLLKTNSPLSYLCNSEVHSMMVYPRREKNELFLELLQIFQERLLCLEKLVLIGYSMRDQELREMVEDAMNKNQYLSLEIVSPDSKKTAKIFRRSNRIEYYCGGVEKWIADRFIEN